MKKEAVMNKRVFAFLLAIVIFIQTLSPGIYAKNNFDDQRLTARVKYTNNKNRENGSAVPLEKERDIDFYIKDDKLFVDGESFLKIFNYSTYFEGDSLFFHVEDAETEHYPNLLRNGHFFKNKKIFDLAYNDPGSTTIKMPVAPFIEVGKFWIPFQFICDALSLKYEYSDEKFLLESKGIVMDDIFNKSIELLSNPLFKNINDLIEDDSGLYGLNTFFITYLSRALDKDAYGIVKWDDSMFREIFNSMFMYESLDRVDQLQAKLDEITKKNIGNFKTGFNTYNFLNDLDIYNMYKETINSVEFLYPDDTILKFYAENMSTHLDKSRALNRLSVEKYIAGYSIVDFICKDCIGWAVDISNIDHDTVAGLIGYFRRKKDENPDVKLYKNAYDAILYYPVVEVAAKIPQVKSFIKNCDKIKSSPKYITNLKELNQSLPGIGLDLAKSFVDIIASKQISSAKEYQKSLYAGFISETFRLDFINEYYKAKSNGKISEEKFEELRSLMYLALVARYTNNLSMSKAICTVIDENALKVIDYFKADNKKIYELTNALRDIKVVEFDDYNDENIIELILTDKNYAKSYIKNYSDLSLINKILLEHNDKSALSNFYKDKEVDKINNQEHNLNKDESISNGCRIVLMLDLSSMYPPMYLHQDYFDLEVELAKLVDEFLSENENNAFSLITYEQFAEVSKDKLLSDNNTGEFIYKPYNVLTEEGRWSEYFMQYYNKFEDRKFIDNDYYKDQSLSFFKEINSPGFLNRESNDLKEIEVYVGNYFVETEGEYADASEATIRPKMNNTIAEYKKYASGKATYSLEFVDEITEELRTSKYKYSDELMRSLQNSGFKKVSRSEDIIKFLKDIIKDECSSKSDIQNDNPSKDSFFGKSFSDEDFINYAIDNFGYDMNNPYDKIFIDDYDDDGRREAYVIINLEDEYYKLYFINYELESVNINYDWNQRICAGLGIPDRLINAGKDKYLIFMENNYGPGVTSYIMSASGKEPYFPDISNNISLFYEENGKYINASSYIEPVYDDKGNRTGGVRVEKNIEYIYDSRLRQFIKK